MEEDKACSQLQLPKKQFGGVNQSVAYATELGEKIVVPFDCLTSPTDARPTRAPRGGV